MYAKYTGFFRTRRENHNLIKFSPFYRGRGPQKILLYFWGEGANEQKTNKRIKISLFGQKKDLRRVRAFARTRQEPRNLIKILPFWGRYNLIKFSPFWGELIFKHPNGCLFISIPCNALCKSDAPSVRCVPSARCGFTATLAIAEI